MILVSNRANPAARLTRFLELPEAVIANVIGLVGAQDLGSLSSGSKCLLDKVLEHIPAITLRVDGTSDRSPWGPKARSRPPHAVQAAQRKSKSTLKLCLKIWGKTTKDQAVVAALKKLAERKTEGGTCFVPCTSLCTLEIQVGDMLRVSKNAAGQLKGAPNLGHACCRAVHMPGHRRHLSW
jgi:hypothetical protein